MIGCKTVANKQRSLRASVSVRVNVNVRVSVRVSVSVSVSFSACYQSQFEKILQALTSPPSSCQLSSYVSRLVEFFR